MLAQTTGDRTWLLAMAVALLLCVALLPTAALIRSQWTPSNLHSLTVGAVSCPSSVVAGWNIGRGWAAVTDVAPCSSSSAPAAWILLRWSGGKRTSLCLDLDGQRC